MADGPPDGAGTTARPAATTEAAGHIPGVGPSCGRSPCTALDRLEPVLARLRTEPSTAAADRRPARLPDLRACWPLLRGERPELAVTVAEQLGGLLAVLRTALEEGDPAAARRTRSRAAPAPRPGGGCSGSPSSGPTPSPAVAGTVVLTIGVDVGGTSVRAGVVDARGTVQDTASAPTPRSVTALEAALAGVIGELRARHRIDAVGLALAGFITPDRRTVRFAPHLSWRDAPVAERMSDPARAARGASSTTPTPPRWPSATSGRRPGRRPWCSSRSAPASARRCCWTGCCSGARSGWPPSSGTSGWCRTGGPARAGRTGCWERYCSGTALATTAVELLARDPGRSPRCTGWSRATSAGSPGAGGRGGPGRRPGGRAPRWPSWPAGWARGWRWWPTSFDPELVVIGGGVSGSAPLFLDEAREHYAARLTGAGRRPLARIRTAQLGEAAAVVGAGQLARELVTAARADAAGDRRAAA